MTLYTGTPQIVALTFNVNPDDSPDSIHYLLTGGEEVVKISPNYFYVGKAGNCETVIQIPPIYEEGVYYIQRVEVYLDGREINKNITALTYCKSIEGSNEANV